MEDVTPVPHIGGAQPIDWSHLCLREVKVGNAQGDPRNWQWRSMPGPQHGTFIFRQPIRMAGWCYRQTYRNDAEGKLEGTALTDKGTTEAAAREQ